MIVYLPGAMRDLRSIAQWYRSELPEGEARFFARFRQTLGRIERAPTSFPIWISATEVRKARVLRSAYSVAFLVHANEVRLVAVVHGARGPAFWTRRLREEP